ncbi:MAG: MupG family TIM beta-alpha barrel fold protein [Clostridium sporogenes]|nr:MupG family TIM beta-alpha barrel fold protein [Clostridium sporogenes]
MGKGISVFLGMDNSMNEILELIKIAKNNGYDRIFTSLHIPEANHEIIVESFKQILDIAKKINMKIIADVSPKGFEYLGIKDMYLSKIKEMGIDVLRLDFGFTNEQIAELTNNNLGIKIELNASTVTKDLFNKLNKYNVNYKNIQACHNYYPRKDTGISESLFLKKNAMLKELGIEISAFIPSLVGKRGPIYEGLPTIEKHRVMKPHLSAKHLFAMGINNVFFGDSMPSKEEITEVGMVKEDIIEPFNTIERELGDVTLDNKGYLRYMGELEIVLKDLEKDDRVNIIAKVKKDELFLLKYINEGRKFRFKIK